MSPIGDLIAIILGLAILIATFIGLLYPWKSYQCHSQWDRSYKSEYSFSTGCMVHFNGKWIPAKNVREF